MTVNEKSDFRLHERFMSRCIELARKGAGSVSPNPMVGSILVADGKVIGEGYHEHYGGPHAEVNAIRSVQDQALLRQSTLYVNLEPCSHQGKTPPCSDLIIEKKIPGVVVACTDPHGKVAGKGIQKLRDAGVEVIEGVLEESALKLNEAFVKSHVENMPFVALKLAQTLDGKIATAKGLSQWITGSESRTHVHELRSRYDAVLTGSGTVVADDPELTVRHLEGRNPLRVVLDRTLRIAPDAKVFNDEAGTLLITSVTMMGNEKIRQLLNKGIEVAFVEECPEGLDLQEVMRLLHNKEILSVLVESGSQLSASLLHTGVVDKAYFYIAPKVFGSDGLDSIGLLGISVPDEAFSFHFEPPSVFGDDLLLEAYVVNTV